MTASSESDIRRIGRACWILVVLLAVLPMGCKPSAPRAVATSSPAATLPAAQPASQPTAATAPVSSQPAQSRPASQPASKPASQPVSTYSPRPPYPVHLYVHSPEDKQPGWLKILQLASTDTLATCSGVFPEQNVIEIQTNNVQMLSLHIGHLPLAEGKRIVLRIDGQPIELARKNRTFVVFQRRATGRWDILRSED